MSAIWAALCSWLNIQHNITTAYHPQSIGLVERLHRCLKDNFRARLAGPDWVDHLPWILLHLRATVRDNDGRSPAELVYSAQLVLPGQLLSSPDPQPAFWTPGVLQWTSSALPLPAIISQQPVQPQLSFRTTSWRPTTLSSLLWPLLGSGPHSSLL
jgi:hypothetical protein